MKIEERASAVSVRELLGAGGRQVVRNTVALLICTGLSQAFCFGIVLLVARGLGPDGLGVFLFALTVQGYLALLGGAGAGQVLVREVAADRARTDEYVTAYLVVVGGTTLGVTAVAFAVLLLAAPQPDERALLAWVLAGNVAASLNLLPLFDAQHYQTRAAAVAVGVDLLAVAAVALAAWTGTLTVPLAGLVMAGKWLAILAGQLLLYHTTIRPLRWVFRPVDLRLFVTSGGRLLAASLLMLVPLNGGVIVTRLLRSEAETAVVGVATQVAAVYFLCCWQVARIVQPHVAGPQGAERWLVRRLAAGYGLAVAGLGVLAALGGYGAVWLLRAEEYRRAVVPMWFLLAGVLALAVGLFLGHYRLRCRQENVIVRSQVLACLAYVLLVVALGVPWGVVGIAAASCGAFTVGALAQAIGGGWDRSE